MDKKTGRPLGLFSELQITHNLQTSYETTLGFNSTNLYDILSNPLFMSSTIQTNHVHHLPSILSTDEELTN
jgi:hypothetical protein